MNGQSTKPYRLDVARVKKVRGPQSNNQGRVEKLAKSRRGRPCREWMDDIIK